MFPNISRSKANEAMKLGHLIEYKKNRRQIFSFKNYAENEPRRLFPDLFLFFKKA